MTPEQLAAAAVKERQQASLEPLKTQYKETVSKLDELAGQIREIDPTWEPPSPPTVASRILDWVKTQGKAVSKPEIAARVKTKYIGGALKKRVEKSKTLTFDKTARTHSVPARGEHCLIIRKLRKETLKAEMLRQFANCKISQIRCEPSFS